MKILTAKQIRDADRATIEREPLSSLDLMERAARGIACRIADSVSTERRLLFCCGRGGNGGDGLAVARILANEGRECAIFLAAQQDELHVDARANLARLPANVKVFDITAERPDIEHDAVIVDALLGVGVTGDVEEPVRSIIEWINSLSNYVISIDIPSGMATEWGNVGTSKEAEATTAVGIAEAIDTAKVTKTIVRAEVTLTIEFPKLAMLQPNMGEYAGRIVVVPIGLDAKFIAEIDTPYHYITSELVEKLRKPRAKFTHKGSYGHTLLVCGSTMMPGAAILATGGALRSGCGLVTAHIPKTERFALISNHPSAMLSLDPAECFSMLPDGLERFSAIGIGPGLGRDPRTVYALEKLLNKVAADRVSPKIVIDADALNIIAQNTNIKRLIPAGSILTPHLGELRRLVGDWTDDREKLEKASELARETRSVVIVKGAHSVICTPDGRFLFNSTGTPGMAKGGSGDVLTGLLAGLMARGYEAETASIIGVYTHGRAGERAAERYGEEAMNASDFAEFM